MAKKTSKRRYWKAKADWMPIVDSDGKMATENNAVLDILFTDKPNEHTTLNMKGNKFQTSLSPSNTQAYFTTTQLNEALIKAITEGPDKELFTNLAESQAFKNLQTAKQCQCH